MRRRTGPGDAGGCQVLTVEEDLPGVDGSRPLMVQERGLAAQPEGTDDDDDFCRRRAEETRAGRGTLYLVEVDDGAAVSEVALHVFHGVRARWAAV